ncbi:MAG: peptide-methionine (S)-S-oxide reductase MsrA [Deltaproteobacteria bacterium]|nr:peptide-methionine (S)-S-oxide reductase MsrA [Deltaproteobacteria bacterium]
MKSGLQYAVLGGGCFWCVEAVFENLKGVQDAESGYAGGDAVSARYDKVASGSTAHVEVAKIAFDPKVISYEDLLRVFFHTHDPTTVNRQGNDHGPQYRSVIFYGDETQKASAQKIKEEIDKSGLWSAPLVTSIEPLKEFYRAEDYHQDYFQLNPSKPYCELVIAPKLKKLKKDFADKLKEPA